jgi:hypothetical protein
MNKKTEQLLEQVERSHDWDCGRTWGGGGTRLSRQNVCRICSLHWEWFSDSQNGVSDRYTFTSGDGDEISLRDAAELEPCIEGEETT